MNPLTRKAHPTDIVMRGLRRVCKCITISANDDFVFCGTTTGDIIQASIQHRVLRGTSPEKNNSSLGVVAIVALKSGELLVGAGDGTVGLVRTDTWKVIRSAVVEGGAMSIAPRGEGQEFLVGAFWNVVLMARGEGQEWVRLAMSLFGSEGGTRREYPHVISIVSVEELADVCKSRHISRVLVFYFAFSDSFCRVISGRCFPCFSGFLLIATSSNVSHIIWSAFLRVHPCHGCAGTSRSLIFRFELADFTHDLRSVAHNSPVNDVAFPRGTSEIFGTCSKEDIRIWHTRTQKQLLRITVPGKECFSLDFSPSGSAILSAWDDGVIMKRIKIRSTPGSDA